MTGHAADAASIETCRRNGSAHRTGSEPFTVAMPRAIEARRDGDAWWFEVDGRELRLSNLTKIFWPDEGYTKGDLLALLLQRRLT